MFNSFVCTAIHRPGETQQIGVCFGILRGAPANLILGSRTLASKASRCSSVRSAAPSLLRKDTDGISSDGRCQEQEHLWQQFFLDPTMWWDNRRHKKSSRYPDFRRKGSGEVLWLNNMFKPAWVDEQLFSLDMLMPHGASPPKSSSPDDPEPVWCAGSEMGSCCSSVRSPSLAHPMVHGPSPSESSPQNKPERERCAGSETGVVTAITVNMLCQQGKLFEAVGALESLALTDSPGSESLFYPVLKLCTAKKDLVVGRRVHELIVKLGYESNAYLGNQILRMYAGGGRLDKAMDVLSRVGKPDAFMWSSIMTACAKQGRPSEAIRLYHEMRRSGVKADAHVFVAALQACAFAGDLESGRKVHYDVLQSGIPTNLFVGNALVDMYAKCGELKAARQVFDHMAAKDVVTWNALISGFAKYGELKDARQVFDSMNTKNVVTWNALMAGYAQQGLGHEALALYGQMEEEGLILADRVTFCCLLNACASTGAIEKGRHLHSQIVERGLLDDVVLGNCLVDMYAKCGYAQEGVCQEAFVVYEQMEKSGLILANPVTFACLLKACANTGALQKGRQLHSQIVERRLFDNIVVGNSLVDMYVKCGEVEDARQVFDSMDAKDVVTWTALIAGYGTCDEGHKALACFEEMLVAGIQPNDVTFTCLLVACSHGGLVDDGRKYFDSMAKQHGITPSLEHYNCMIDLLGRAGHLDEAEKMLEEKMRLSSETQSNVVGLKSLLNACKSHRDVERARWCFESIVRLDPQEAPAYVLMASAYANAGRWTDVDRIEKQRMMLGANKKPAVATIEVNNEIHRFVVGEKREDIALQVERTNARLKQEGGHIPHTKLVLKPISVPHAEFVFQPMSEKEKEDVLCGHAEKLALAFGLLNTPSGTPLMVTKNLRMCSDCHSSTEIMSRLEQRDIVVRDGYRVHRFAAGCCSCKGRP